jgi:adenylate cyclase
MAEAGALDPTRAELRERFAEGLDAYRQQDWEAAEAQFQACRRLVPDDGPAAVYLERIDLLRANPPPDWDGVWRLTGK